jgi:5'(3')-deoxyribonucleotidase
MTYIIGLDIDGVCYHFERTARYMLRRKLSDEGREVPAALYEPSYSWNAIEENVSPEDWGWLWTAGVEAGLFRYGHVVGGAIEGVQALNELGDVVAITTRPKQAVHDTLVWLATMFDKAPLSGINILSHGQAKSEVRPQPNIYVDDGTHNLDDIVENTKPHVRAVLFDQPWNQGYTHPYRNHRWARAVGWAEVVRLVREAKEGVW